MKYVEVKKRLSNLANGKYRGIAFEENYYILGAKRKYSLYVDGYGYSHGKSWAEAFKQLEAKIATFGS